MFTISSDRKKLRDKTYKSVCLSSGGLKLETVAGYVIVLFELSHECLCRIIQDYVVRENDYTLRPSTTAAHSNKVS